VIPFELNKDSDDYLIKRAKKGDSRAFDKLIVRYQKKIYYMAIKMVMNHQDADDVTQETFIKAYKNLHTFKEGYKFYVWLYRIATNTAINLIKKRKYVGNSLDSLIENNGYVLPETETPYRSFEENELKGLVKTALNNISPEARAVFLLRTSEGMSYQEIADILDISIGTVMSRLNRTREKLKKSLKKAHEQYEK